jgi:hypothetical protein
MCPRNLERPGFQTVFSWGIDLNFYFYFASSCTLCILHFPTLFTGILHPRSLLIQLLIDVHPLLILLCFLINKHVLSHHGSRPSTNCWLPANTRSYYMSIFVARCPCISVPVQSHHMMLWIFGVEVLTTMACGLSGVKIPRTPLSAE